jgi:hypothetical protein
MAPERRQLIQEEHAVVHTDTFPDCGTCPPPINPTS